MSTLTRTVNFRGHKLEVEFEYTPYCRGAREHGTGIPLEPDDEEGIEEINAVRCDDTDGNFVELLDENLLTDLSTELLELLSTPDEDEY